MRDRALQVVLVVVGLFYSSLWYFLLDDLAHARWLREHNDVMPMFVSLLALLGPCLLFATRSPAKHRLMIFYAAFSSLVHAATMTIQSWQAAAHGMHRHDSPQDIVIFVVIGGVLLGLFPTQAAMIGEVGR